MTYLLAIDQGTSSTRAMLYTLDGKVAYSSHDLLTQYYPHPGWVEHDPEEIWQKTLKSIQEVVSQVDIDQIVACGITNQRETTVIWDKKTGRCLARAIVWQDRRTHKFCESLEPHTELIHSKTGLFPDPYFSATKLSWLLKNVAEANTLVKANRLAFGTIDSFLLWRLTGGAHLTDITNASRTLLFNIHTQEWDEQLLGLFDIPASILPSVRANDSFFGTIKGDLLGKAIPITGVAGDQQAALMGLGCFASGMAKATFGTGGFLLLNTGQKPIKSKHKLLTTIAYRIKDQTTYGLEGSFYQAGTTVKWLRDELHLIEAASETESLARSLSSNEGVYLIPSFTGLGAPHWFSTPGAAIMGLSRTSGKAHFARAALESVGYQTRDILTCMEKDSAIPLELLRVDGGMAANNWLLQFLASLCNLTIERPTNIETTAQGAAVLAALGCGAIGSIKDLQATWVLDRQFIKEANSEIMEQYYQGWQRALLGVKAFNKGI
jgi:glycerol kinase